MTLEVDLLRWDSWSISIFRAIHTVVNWHYSWESGNWESTSKGLGNGIRDSRYRQACHQS